MMKKCSCRVVLLLYIISRDLECTLFLKFILIMRWEKRRLEDKHVNCNHFSWLNYLSFLRHISSWIICCNIHFDLLIRWGKLMREILLIIAFNFVRLKRLSFCRVFDAGIFLIMALFAVRFKINQVKDLKWKNFAIQDQIKFLNIRSPLNLKLIF